MPSIRHGVSLGLLALAPLLAQELKVPPSLSAKASQTFELTLDRNMLQLAGKFLSSAKSDEVDAKKVIADLKSIVVRSFTFDKEGTYSETDVEAFRAQFRGPGWSRTVGIHSKKDRDNAEVYVKNENGKMAGLALISAGPKELTIVSLAGTIDPEQIGTLGDKFGIPGFQFEKRKNGKED